MKLSVLLVLCLFVTSNLIAGSITRHIEDESGNVVKVKVIAPIGKAVDGRIFEGFVHNGWKYKDRVSIPMQGGQFSPIDLSGYMIELSAQAVTCSSVLDFIQRTPATLSANSSMFICSAGLASGMDADAYPTTVSDVNIYIRVGANICKKSEQNGQILDSAACFAPGCLNNAAGMCVEFRNKLAFDAQFIGSIRSYYVTEVP